MGTNEHRKLLLSMIKLLYFGVGRVLDQDILKACGVSFFGDIQDLPGCLPVQPSVGSLLCMGVGLNDL